MIVLGDAGFQKQQSRLALVTYLQFWIRTSGGRKLHLPS